MVQWGRINIVPSAADVVTSQRVNLIWKYAYQPAVFVSEIHTLSVGLEVAKGAVGLDGFTLNLKRANTASTSVFWLAIGNGTNSLPE